MKKLFLFFIFLLLLPSAITSFAETTRIFSQTFNAVGFPPSGWVITNAGNGNDWARATDYPFEGFGVLRYLGNFVYPANTWAFTPNISMTAGYSYYAVFYERTLLASGTENLKITVGQGQTVSQQTTIVGNYPGLNNTVYSRVQTSGFIPSVNGNYNFAFNCYSPANQTNLYIDSVNIYQVTSPNPVDISLFKAVHYKRDITLYWQTCSEINNSGFEIERRIQTDPKLPLFSAWTNIGFLNGNGNTYQPVSYSYIDSKLTTGKYQYRLRQIDYNGSFEFFTLNDPDIIEIGKPVTANLSQNYPNPSNPKSKIDYEIPFDGKVIIKIFDITGREISELLNEFKSAGFYSTEFDGSNISSGVYFYSIIAKGEGSEFTRTKKLVLIK